MTVQRTSVPKVVILGGGTAGASLAARLCGPGGPVRRGLCRVTVVDSSPAHVRAPLLPHLVAGSTRALRLVATAMTAATTGPGGARGADGADVLTGRFVAVDGDRRTIEVSDALTDERRTVPWDHLVVALGSCNEDQTLRGVADHAMTLRTPSDALALRQRVMSQLAAAAADADRREEHSSFVVVGAGHAGIATAAALRRSIDEATAHASRDIARCAADARVVLVDRKPRLMTQRSIDESEWLADRVAAAGIELVVGTAVEAVDASTVRFTRNRGAVAAATCVWTAGVRAVPIVQAAFDRCELTSGGRLVVNPMLEVRGMERVWAIGDSASVPYLDAGGDCPALGAFATAQARRLARSLSAVLEGEWPRSFRSVPDATIVSLGPGDAAGFVRNRRVHGPVAAAAWFAGVMSPELLRHRRAAAPILTTTTSRPYAAPRQGASVVSLGRKPTS